MLFKRRDEMNLLQRLRVGLWPRTSWRRSTLYYIKRVLRLSATPHAVALGFATGAFVSMTPFIGLHFLITFAIAWIIGGNMIAGAIGTSLGNPLTFPLIWAGTYKIGSFIIRGEHVPPPPRLGLDLAERSWSHLWPVLEPMTLGAIPVGIVVGAISYLIVYKAVAAYQHARRERFASRRAVGRVTAMQKKGKEGVGFSDMPS